MKYIPLGGKKGKGKFAIVDDKNFSKLNKYKWHLISIGYAETKIGDDRFYMHRMIMHVTSRLQVDHINHDILDNRESNLRLVTVSQNHMNMRKHRGSSKYKGVSWNKKLQKWETYININYKRYRIGFFKEEKDAARAYNLKAIELAKEFSKLNTIG